MSNFRIYVSLITAAVCLRAASSVIAAGEGNKRKQNTSCIVEQRQSDEKLKKKTLIPSLALWERSSFVKAKCRPFILRWIILDLTELTQSMMGVYSKLAQ